MSDLQTRSRNLSLRTYSVICLNEECGLLEWVNGTNCKYFIIVIIILIYFIILN